MPRSEYGTPIAPSAVACLDPRRLPKPLAYLLQPFSPSESLCNLRDRPHYVVYSRFEVSAHNGRQPSCRPVLSLFLSLVVEPARERRQVGGESAEKPYPDECHKCEKEEKAESIPCRVRRPAHERCERKNDQDYGRAKRPTDSPFEAANNLVQVGKSVPPGSPCPLFLKRLTSRRDRLVRVVAMLHGQDESSLRESDVSSCEDGSPNPEYGRATARHGGIEGSGFAKHHRAILGGRSK